MNLKELKQKSPTELLTQAEDLGIEDASSMRKQDLMFAILKKLADRLQLPLRIFDDAGNSPLNR